MGLGKSISKSVNKAVSATSKVVVPVKSVRNTLSGVWEGIKDDPAKAALIAGAAVATGGLAAGAVGAAGGTFLGMSAGTVGAIAGGTMAAQGAQGLSAAHKASVKAEKAQDAYNREVAAANEAAHQANRTQLLSLRKQYTKRNAPTVSMGGSGGTTDETRGGITLG